MLNGSDKPRIFVSDQTDDEKLTLISPQKSTETENDLTSNPIYPWYSPW